MGKVAIIGASGFVGSTLTEWLQQTGNWEIVLIIHSSGNAWRLARSGVKLHQVDLLKQDQIANAIKGCTHVVNCSRGGGEVMLKGLKNLLSECQKVDDVRFVHLGSVAVYGDPPPPESENEDAPAKPNNGSYGWVKLQQEILLKKHAKEGLSSVVLCPPNIIGPYSIYLLQILDTLLKDRFAYVEGGSAICNTVDVTNLCYAIELSLDKGPRDGSRLFVTDGEKILWRDVVETLMRLNPKIRTPKEINRIELKRVCGDAKRPLPIFKAAKHLVSSDVREALRKDPLLARVDTVIRNSVSLLGSSVEETLRLAIEGPVAVPKLQQESGLNLQLCSQQLRGVWHSSKRAEDVLGYRPVFTFQESMAAFSSYYEELQGFRTPVGDLLKIGNW